MSTPQPPNNDPIKSDRSVEQLAWAIAASAGQQALDTTFPALVTYIRRGTALPCPQAKWHEANQLIQQALDTTFPALVTYTRRGTALPCPQAKWHEANQ
ncbi:MAG: hypothetical protein ACIWVG_07590, partial [Gloeotrichia echinulata HAB0833]